MISQQINLLNSINNSLLLHLLFELIIIFNILYTIYLFWWRRKDNKKIKKNRDYYKSLFKDNKIINLLIDPDTGYITDANYTALNFYGYDSEQIKNKKITDINILSDIEVFEEMQLAKKEKRNFFKFTHRISDGSLRNVEVYSHPIKIDENNYLYSFIYDVTDKKILETKVEEQQRKYQTLFETTGAATFCVEKDKTISLVNKEAEILTGYQKNELEGKMNFTDLIAYPEEKEKMLSYHRARKANMSGVINRYEFSLRDKKGDIKDVIINIRMIPTTKQSILSLVDITESKKREKELLGAYNKLNTTMDKAKKLHQKYLPAELPSIEGLSFAAYYHATDKIGGDFYNYIKIDGKLIFYLVDITGHGLEGAMLNIFVRESINNYIIEYRNREDEIKPNEIIEYVFKKYKKENFPEDYFVCITIGVIDIEDFLLKISNMGNHIMPLVVGPDANIKDINIKGLPISNAIESSNYISDNISIKNIHLKPDTIIFISTDGLIEEYNDGENYGKDRIKDVLKTNCHNTPEIIKKNIIKSFKEFKVEKNINNITNQDDITFFIIKRNLE
ncbi:MAG: PAS domain S-box protein [Halanaerobiaceae bacterium]